MEFSMDFSICSLGAFHRPMPKKPQPICRASLQRRLRFHLDEGAPHHHSHPGRPATSGPEQFLQIWKGLEGAGALEGDGKLGPKFR